MTHDRSRESVRLRNYDYASVGFYFVTICTHQRQCLFGTINNSIMQLNNHGLIAKKCWLQIPQHFAAVGLDHFVVMPNHMHALLHLHMETGATVATIIRSLKAAVTRQLQRPIWQRNYWERVIRTERELGLAREYIANNPAQWGTDKAEDY
jgi:REP element-mobilizing transposase RayT